MDGTDDILSSEDVKNMELAIKSLRSTSGDSAGTSPSRSDSPRRPNSASPRTPTKKVDLSYSLFRGELDSVYKLLLTWVSARCPDEGWERLKTAAKEAGSPPWLTPETFGLDLLSQKVLALTIAHCICAHRTLTDGPFSWAEDISASEAMYKLALLPPKGMHDVVKVLGADAPLVKLGLIEVNENLSPRRRRFEKNALSISRFFRTTFSLNLHALATVLGLEPMEDDTGPSVDELLLPDEVRSILDGQLSSAPSSSRCFTVYLKGPRQSGRRTLAHALATRMRLPLKQVRPFDSPLPGSALLVDVHGNFDHGDWANVQEHPGLVFLRQVNGDSTYDFDGVADLVLDMGDLQVGPMVAFAAGKLKAAGPLFSACDPFEVAHTGAQPGKLIDTIERLTRDAQWRHHSPEVVRQLLVRTLRTTPTKRDSSQFFEMVTPRLGLDDIRLPDPVLLRFKRLIQAIKGREEMLKNWDLDTDLVGRAQGICLFHGPSGTGKTMGAEILATELGLPLWRVNASELESAYVGESESRLHRFFHAARGRKAVILLDEADAVLADRGRAEGSTRRYSVSLVNQWLRELDQFDGILVYTTNHAEGLDPALERRIQFRIEFPQPEPDVREQIWSNLFRKAPIPGHEALDLKFIAHNYALAGGRIRNAFLDACHRAAEVGHISQEILVSAAEEEHQSSLQQIGKTTKRIQGFAGAV